MCEIIYEYYLVWTLVDHERHKKKKAPKASSARIFSLRLACCNTRL